MEKIIVHPSFSSTSTSPTANLALVKLSRRVGETYRSLCLQSQDTEVTGSVVLVGWRISPVLGSLAQTLVSLPTNIVSQSDCGVDTDLICAGADTRLEMGTLGSRGSGHSYDNNLLLIDIDKLLLKVTINN